MKILVCGDLHIKDNLNYSEYIADGRNSEKKEILDFILDSAKDCDHIVFLGDNFHSRNNSSETNREFVEFLEKFKNKEIYVISGNHEKKGNGKTAIDFLGEIKHPNWHVFTRPGVMEFKAGFKVDFLPYMLKSELEVETDEEASRKIIDSLNGGEILFAHHSISDTTFNGISTNSLKEVVLSKNKLEEKYKLIVAGHIHASGVFGKTVLAGSVFNNEAGETEKFIWKIKDDLSVEQIKLPGRRIYKLENPTQEKLEKIPKESIVKAIITDKNLDIEKIKEDLIRFDASLIIENYPNERKKMHDVQNGAFDFSVENLLKLYAKEREISLEKLLTGFALINN